MNKKIFYAFIISFSLLILVIILNRVSFDNMKEYTRAVNHTQEVITSFQHLSNHFKSAQIYSPKYETIPERDLYGLYRKEALKVTGEVKALKKLVKDNPAQTRLVDSLSSMISGQIYTLLQKSIDQIIESGEGWRLNYLFAIDKIVSRGITQENQLLRFRNDKLRQSTSLNNFLSVIFAFIAVIIIVSTFLSTIFLTRKRKWLQGFLESVLNTSQNGIINYKAIKEHGKIADFKLEFVNKAIEPLLGIKTDIMMGKKLKELPAYAAEANLFERYVNVVETGQSAVFEALYKHNGIEKWFIISLVKLQEGLTASFQDITQLKKYEEDLKSNILQLQKSNNELEQYAYVASHDLQEPLRKIRSFGSYLQETQANKLDEKGQLQLEKIMQAAERMSILIKDILSFSSLKKDDLFTSVDLNKIIENVKQDLDLFMIQKQGEIKYKHLPAIEAIPLQMNQLFYNLINNSLKFARETKKPVITIWYRDITENEKAQLELEENNQRYYEIVLSDNGIGFSQEYAAQIFGLFKRLNDRQLYPGSGIGLALCKKVVDNHGGIIYAEGKENEGASFHIILPATQPKN